MALHHGLPGLCSKYWLPSWQAIFFYSLCARPDTLVDYLEPKSCHKLLSQAILYVYEMKGSEMAVTKIEHPDPSLESWVMSSSGFIPEERSEPCLACWNIIHGITAIQIRCSSYWTSIRLLKWYQTLVPYVRYLLACIDTIDMQVWRHDWLLSAGPQEKLEGSAKYGKTSSGTLSTTDLCSMM